LFSLFDDSHNDEDVEVAKEKARTALAAALMDDEDEVEGAKAKARSALAAALMDDQTHVEHAKEKARAALNAALGDDGDEVEDAKAKARSALAVALMDDDDEVAMAKDKARQALAAALGGDEDEAKHSPTRRAMTGPDLDEHALVEEAKELAKEKARDALQAALFADTGDDEEAARERTRGALDKAVYRSDTQLVDSMSSALKKQEGVPPAGSGGDMSEQKKKLTENKEHMERMNHALRGEVDEMNGMLKDLFRELEELKKKVPKK
jgi:hypothetical protein